MKLGDEDETDSNFKQIVNMKAEDDPAVIKRKIIFTQVLIYKME